MSENLEGLRLSDIKPEKMSKSGGGYYEIRPLYCQRCNKKFEGRDFFFDVANHIIKCNACWELMGGVKN